MDVEINKLPEPDTLRGFDDFRRISALEVGTGNRAFKSDESGIWLGANKFADAPFSVDMLGAMAVKSATFKDEDDTTFIDAKGLISTANFTFDSIRQTTSLETTSTSFVDISSFTLSFSLSRTARVLFILTGVVGSKCELTNASRRTTVVMDLDGTDLNPSLIWQALGTNSPVIPAAAVTIHTVESVASGSHVLKGQWKVDNNSNGGKAIVEERVLTYLVLGK